MFIQSNIISYNIIRQRLHSLIIIFAVANEIYINVILGDRVGLGCLERVLLEYGIPGALVQATWSLYNLYLYSGNQACFHCLLGPVRVVPYR